MLQRLLLFLAFWKPNVNYSHVIPCFRDPWSWASLILDSQVPQVLGSWLLESREPGVLGRGCCISDPASQGLKSWVLSPLSKMLVPSKVVARSNHGDLFCKQIQQNSYSTVSRLDLFVVKIILRYLWKSSVLVTLQSYYRQIDLLYSFFLAFRNNRGKPV